MIIFDGKKLVDASMRGFSAIITTYNCMVTHIHWILNSVVNTICENGYTTNKNECTECSYIYLLPHFALMDREEILKLSFILQKTIKWYGPTYKLIRLCALSEIIQKLKLHWRLWEIKIFFSSPSAVNCDVFFTTQILFALWKSFISVCIK